MCGSDLIHSKSEKLQNIVNRNFPVESTRRVSEIFDVKGEERMKFILPLILQSLNI